MTARLILTYPNPVLRSYAESVDNEDSDEQLTTWCKDLRDTMIANGGMGLAAPQVGIKKKIFVLDVTSLENPDAFCQTPENGTIIAINPVLSNVTDKDTKSIEACLSIPGMQYEVRRYSIIDLCFLNSRRELIATRITGKDAILVQHENDHLIGKLFIDRLNVFDKKQFMKRNKPAKKEMSEGQINSLREQNRTKARANRKKK